MSRNLAAFLSSLCFVSSVTAQPCDLPSVAQRPGPAIEPTEVLVGAYVVDLVEIDSAKQSFSADFFLTATWTDPRLAADRLGVPASSCSVELQDIWQPRIELLNRRRLLSEIDNRLMIDDQGRVQFSRRFNGELQTALDVREFPFDSQILRISSASLLPAREVEVQIDPRSGARKELSVAGWSLEMAESQVVEERLETLDRSLNRVDIQLRADRNQGFYVWKMLVPVTLIVLMAWNVFWLGLQHVPSRIGISTATIFSLIAFQLGLGRLLPPVAYLTRADRFTIGSMVLILTALVVVIVTSHLADNQRADFAQRLNQWARWSYLGCLIVLIFITIAP